MLLCPVSLFAPSSCSELYVIYLNYEINHDLFSSLFYINHDVVLESTWITFRYPNYLTHAAKLALKKTSGSFTKKSDD
jgi:hypothetical protein